MRTFSSIIVSLYFLGGIIISILGILGVYLGKTFDEIKKRPLYLVRNSTFNLGTTKNSTNKLEKSVNLFEDVIATPWDSRIFGFNTFEIVDTSDGNLKKTLERIFQENRLGHYTVKLNPLNNKKILHEFGFYYCDTLI